MDELVSLLSPLGAHRITPGELRDRVSTDAGIYVVWLVSKRARADIGLDSSEALAIYVGQAGAGGIRGRIRGRIHNTWPQLAEVLAVRGHVLFPWWLRYKFTDSRRYPRTPLAQLSQEQALAWQHEHLRWCCVPCPLPLVTRLEREAIQYLRPLLNRTGMGRFPPQLRTEDSANSARARWLWHLSWAATVIAGARSPTQLRSAADGFPVLDGSTPVAACAHVREPSERQLDRLMERAAQAAAPEVRDAVTASVSGSLAPQVNRSRGLTTQVLREHRQREMIMWWAAHAAAPLLQPAPSVSIEDALSASLRREPLPGWSTALPDEQRTQQLLLHIKRVIGERRH